MFDLFKKNPPNPQPLIPQPNETNFEVGKEIQSRDPKSGMFIYRIAMSPQNRKMIFDVIQKNAGVGQRLITLTINLCAILRQLDLEDKNRIGSEKDIADIIQKVRDEMKLSKEYEFNMQLGVFERREPPE